MVKSVLSVYHQGLRDWIIQRISAIVMALYSGLLIGFILLHHPLTFTQWHNLYSYSWVKVSTLIFALSIFSHAWIGIWTVFTDYVKCSVIRAVLNTLVILALIAFFFWTLLILWSV